MAKLQIGVIHLEFPDNPEEESKDYVTCLRTERLSRYAGIPSEGIIGQILDAPAIAAPDGSRTVPEIAAVAPCACNCPAPNVIKMAAMIVREIVFMDSPDRQNFFLPSRHTHPHITFA